MGRFLCGLLLLTSLVRATAPAHAAGGDTPGKDDAPIPFERYGERYVQTHCKAGATAATCKLPEIREQHYAHAVIGVFDIAYPAATLVDKERAEDLRTIAKGLLDAQSRWIDWLARGDVAAAKADVALLADWVKGWKLGLLAKSKSAEDKNLFRLLEANEAQLAAAKRLSEFLLKPESLGVAPKKSEPVRLLFAPKRHDFIELLGYAGLRDPSQKATLWTQNSAQWTNFWLDWDLALALEYPAWKEDPEFKSGTSMNKFDANGLTQHVIQQALQALLWTCYGEGDARYLQQALALNMAIAICGEGNALEGDAGLATTGDTTQPYEKFVPGGNSAGGFLPPIPAGAGDTLKVNAWRKSRGADHFAGPLREGQKNGQKLLLKDRPDKIDPVLGRDRYAHFALSGAEEKGKHLVSAPFFGKHANEKPYPSQEFLIDYREFFRAYRTAFFHWLQTQGDPAGDEASAEKYRTLLRALAVREAGKSFEALIGEVYGTPLSGKNGDTDSLEWRFLEWLGKGK